MTAATRPSQNRFESVEELMLSATELFHYSYKFRNQTVVITLEDPGYLFSLLPDFRVLLSSHIGAAVFLSGSPDLKTQIEACNVRGHAFRAVETSDSEADADFIRAGLAESKLPVVICPAGCSAQELCGAAFASACQLAAIKFFYVQTREGLVINDTFLSHPTTPELLALLDPSSTTSIPQDLLRFFCEKQHEEAIDVAIIGARAGALFQELFTHRGSGTLLTTTYPNLIRTATTEDVAELNLLLTPYIQSGSLLPMPEELLVAEISQFHVFTINGEIVAAARLRAYEDACELGKFCTLPRYQRKGRARLLALSLISLAREMQKRYVFALSLEPGMWAFFLGLGFHECSYADLPESWLQSYDQARGSKAFRLEL